MRIALINKVFSHSHGGGERYAVDLANALLEQGHELHLFGNSFADLLPGMRTYHVPMPRKPGWLRNLYFSRAAARALREHRAQYDVSYALTPMFPVDACLLGGGMNRYWLHSRINSPFCEWLYAHISPNHWAQNWLEDQICRRAENCRLIVANSELVRGHVMKYGHVAPERVVTLYNAIDERQFNLQVREQFRAATRAELGLREDDLAIIYSSMNWERKGLATIIRALGHFASARYRVVVIGKGNPLKYKQLACECGLREEQLIFYGYTREQEKMYAAGDVLAFPSQYDAFGNVVFEAMACGTPVITTAQTGAGEKILEGVDGFVMARHDDDAALALHLQFIMQDEIREKMGLAAAEIMREHTFARLAERTVKVLEKIFSNG